MKLQTLADLYLTQVRDMHSCERQLLKALPKMAEAAINTQLRMAFEHHVEETKAHLKRLDVILGDLDETAGRKVCAAAAGLVEEAEEVIDHDGDDDARDAGLICAAQKIEHYEIATYGCLRSYATRLGREKDAEALEQTLDEEKQADASLNELAISLINEEAMG